MRHFVGLVLAETNVLTINTNLKKELIGSAYEIGQCLIIDDLLIDCSASLHQKMTLQGSLSLSTKQRQLEFPNFIGDS